MKHKLLVLSLATMPLIFSPILPTDFASATSIIVNGDFSDLTDLAGFTKTGEKIGEPTGEFAQLETDGNFLRTLQQTFAIPSTPTWLSFDFAFSTGGAPPIAGFPDSFAASLLTTADSDFLDILVVDAFGAVPDPSDGIEAITGAVPIEVMLDPSVMIPGFMPFDGGTTFTGRVNLWLPQEVLGEEATIFFDLFDELDGFATIAAVDNVGAAPIPEPATSALVAVGLTMLGWFARNKPKTRA